MSTTRVTLAPPRWVIPASQCEPQALAPKLADAFVMPPAVRKNQLLSPLAPPSANPRATAGADALVAHTLTRMQQMVADFPSATDPEIDANVEELEALRERLAALAPSSMSEAERDSVVVASNRVDSLAAMLRHRYRALNASINAARADVGLPATTATDESGVRELAEALGLPVPAIGHHSFARFSDDIGTFLCSAEARRTTLTLLARQILIDLYDEPEAALPTSYPLTLALLWRRAGVSGAVDAASLAALVDLAATGETTRSEAPLLRALVERQKAIAPSSPVAARIAEELFDAQLEVADIYLDGVSSRISSLQQRGRSATGFVLRLGGALPSADDLEPLFAAHEGARRARAAYANALASGAPETIGPARVALAERLAALTRADEDLLAQLDANTDVAMARLARVSALSTNLAVATTATAVTLGTLGVAAPAAALTWQTFAVSVLAGTGAGAGVGATIAVNEQVIIEGADPRRWSANTIRQRTQDAAVTAFAASVATGVSSARLMRLFADTLGSPALLRATASARGRVVVGAALVTGGRLSTDVVSAASLAASGRDVEAVRTLREAPLDAALTGGSFLLHAGLPLGADLRGYAADVGLGVVEDVTRNVLFGRAPTDRLFESCVSALAFGSTRIAAEAPPKAQTEWDLEATAAPVVDRRAEAIAARKAFDAGAAQIFARSPAAPELDVARQSLATGADRKAMAMLEAAVMDPAVTVTARVDVAGPTNGLALVELSNGLRGVWKPQGAERMIGRPNLEVGGQTPREAAAYIVDKAMGNAAGVPPTVYRELGGERGSLMVFVDGVVRGSAAPVRSAESTAAVEVFDQVLGNLDRHNNNYLVGPNGHVVPIDHGISLPMKNGDQGAGVKMDFAAERPLTSLERSRVQQLRDAHVTVRAELEAVGIPGPAIDAMFARVDAMLTRGALDPLWLRTED